jgi:hypothetical protein
VIQLGIAAVLVVGAVAVATVLRRRGRVDAPTQGNWEIPQQLDRRHFVRPDAPWLVAVFSSASCQSCADVVRKAEVLDCADVAVDVAEVAARPEVHRSYRIDAVPLVVVADAAGVVRAGFLGPVTATDLWAAVAEARAPGSSPEPGLGRP